MEMRMKKCSKCGEVKPITDFYAMKGMRDGYRNECKRCHLAARKLRYDENPQPAKDRTTQWRRENKERHAQYLRDRRARPGAKRKERDGHLRRKFGITLEQYEEMLLAQGGVCAICERPPRSDISLHVDHEHDGGRVRGLLCFSCNQALGSLGDESDRCRAAAAYLDSHAPEPIEETALVRARVQALVLR